MKKTQKSFRKKALLSSLSMLLVSTVAVGSATFAWFTQNPDATAEGLKLKATSANGLQIKSETQQVWTHNAVLNANGTTADATTKTDAEILDAVSFILDDSKTELGNTAYNVEAENDNNYIAADDSKITAKTSTGFYQEKIYARLTGTGTSDTVQLDGVTVEWQDGQATINSAIRIAVSYYDATAKTSNILGVFKQSAGAMRYIKDGSLDYNKTTNISSYTAKAFTTEAGGLAIDAGTVAKTEGDYFVVTMYLDGEDDKCYTDNVSANDIVKSVSLKLNLKPAP